MIGSFTALLIILGFVLPGYVTRWVIGRRIYLRPIGDFELLFQSVLISSCLLVVWSAATAVPWIHALSPLHIVTQMDHVPPLVGWNALASLVVLLLLSVLVGFWDWLVNVITTYGQNLHPYPMLYRLLGVMPLSTGASPWVRVEMENDQVVMGRVIEFGLDGPDAGSMVLVMVAILRGDNAVENRPAEERWYIPQKSIRDFRIEYVKLQDHENTLG